MRPANEQAAQPLVITPQQMERRIIQTHFEFQLKSVRQARQRQRTHIVGHPAHQMLSGRRQTSPGEQALRSADSDFGQKVAVEKRAVNKFVAPGYGFDAGLVRRMAGNKESCIKQRFQAARFVKIAAGIER